MSQIEDGTRTRSTEDYERQLLQRNTMGEPVSSAPRQPNAPAQPSNPAAAPVYYAAPQALPKNAPLLERWKAKGGILGGIASVLLALAKFWAPVAFLLGKIKFLAVGLKLLLMAGSMLLSIWAYGSIYGIPFGIGIVALIFIHECGHAIAGMMRGHKPGIMVFVPFMGAFVTVGRGDTNITESAFIGIMGPIFGTLASLACVAIFAVTQSPLYLSLAAFGFFINLFNLAPTPPLDGGWITPLFSPKLLAIGSILLVFIGFRNPLIWILAAVSIPRIIAAWKADPKTQPYYQATVADKWRYGLLYFGLILFLGLGYLALHSYLIQHFPTLIS